MAKLTSTIWRNSYPINFTRRLVYLSVFIFQHRKKSTQKVGFKMECVLFIDKFDTIDTPNASIWYIIHLLMHYRFFFFSVFFLYFCVFICVYMHVRVYHSNSQRWLLFALVALHASLNSLFKKKVRRGKKSILARIYFVFDYRWLTFIAILLFGIQ